MGEAKPTLWGVELEDGTITRCPVSECIYEGRHICWSAGANTSGSTPREAVVRWAARMGLAAEGILAPGAPSRAELIAERDRLQRMYDELIGGVERLRKTLDQGNTPNG